MIICGRKSSSDEETDKKGRYTSSASTPRRSKKSKRIRKSNGKDSRNENPYAERGLDKFYKLLADVEEMKQEIYSQIGAEEISLIRFVYSDSFEHVRPIVVRVKNSDSNALTTSSPVETILDKRVDDYGSEENRKEEKKKECLNRSCCCFGVMVVLVLLFLAIYGRFLAIICSTIMWYLVSVNLEIIKVKKGDRGN